MRRGDAEHKFYRRRLQVTTAYPSGNIAINCDIVAEAMVRGVTFVEARNCQSGFEWTGSLQELHEQGEVLPGEDGDFYLLRKPV